MQKRGATIYCEFLGGSFTCDAYHMTEPRPDGKFLVLNTYEILLTFLFILFPFLVINVLMVVDILLF